MRPPKPTEGPVQLSPVAVWGFGAAGLVTAAVGLYFALFAHRPLLGLRWAVLAALAAAMAALFHLARRTFNRQSSERHESNRRLAAEVIAELRDRRNHR